MSKSTQYNTGDVVFPPYGIMPKLYEDWARNTEQPVADWLPGVPDRVKKWKAFLEDTLGEIERVLWPRFGDGGWPADSHARMLELTKADFDLIAALDKKPGRGLDTVPMTPLASFDCPTHRTWYLKEDGQLPGMQDRYKHYDKTRSVEEADFVRTTWISSRQKKESTLGQGSVTMLFKRALQRPRPYQMALAMGRPGGHNYEEALTAATPSMSSGHCLQGLIGVGGIFEFFIEKGTPIIGEHADALRQYGVDIGDRRVMAGVHYPSDNLCSWIIALRMADYVYREAEAVKKELALAIQQSQIFELITRSESDVYKPALKALSQLMPTSARAFHA